MTDLIALFEQAGVPEAYARRAAERLGPGAAGSLRADPWRLLRVPGVRPEQADHFARRLLEDTARPDDPRRGRALVVHVLTDAARRGHTAMPAKSVLSALGALRVQDAERAVNDALNEAEVVALVEEPDFDEADGDLDDLPEPEESLGLARYALAEESAAEGLQRLAVTAVPLLPDDKVKAIRAELPEDRRLALTAAMLTGVSVLHGSPDAVEEAVAALAVTAAKQGLRATVATVTAQAAAGLGVLLDGSEVAASDVLRLLEAHSPEGGPSGIVAFGRGERRPLETDLVFVPGAEALDVELAAALVEACADGTHLVLGGDPAALPSAGPGRVLADLAGSETVAVIELDPGSDGPLAVFTAGVRAGELAAVEAPDREVVLVPAADSREIVHRTVQLVTDSIPRALGIPVADVQVVTPLVGGEAGAGALNVALKAQLNPGPGAYGGFDPGDRVIAAAALPGACAGETGTVTGASPEGLQIAFGPDPANADPADAGTVVVPVELVARLRHGWAVPVALGRMARRPAVVAVFPAEAADQVSRALVVTASGLARRHLSVVHDAGPALARAVREVTVTPRDTRLAELVRL